MTVKELIEVLKQMPEHYPVWVARLDSNEGVELQFVQRDEIFNDDIVILWG